MKIVAGTWRRRSSSMAAWLTNDLTVPLSSSASIESVMLVSNVRATIGCERDPWNTTPAGRGKACAAVRVVIVVDTIAALGRSGLRVHAAATRARTATAAAAAARLIRLVDLALGAQGAVGVTGALGAPAFAEDLIDDVGMSATIGVDGGTHQMGRSRVAGREHVLPLTPELVGRIGGNRP